MGAEPLRTNRPIISKYLDLIKYPALKHMCPLGRRGAENGFFRSVLTPKYTTLIKYPALRHMCPLGRRGAENGFFRSVFTPKHTTLIKYPALKHMCPLGRRGAKNGFFRLVCNTKIPCAETHVPFRAEGGEKRVFSLGVYTKSRRAH